MIKDKNTKVFVGPSILSADFADLAKDCQEVIDLGADSLHIDVMDGYSFKHSVTSSLTSPSDPQSSNA